MKLKFMLVLLVSLCMAGSAFAQGVPAKPNPGAALAPAGQPPVGNAYGAQPAALSNSDKATFAFVLTGAAMTATDDAIFIKAGSTLVTRIRRICIINPGIFTGAAVVNATLELRSTDSSTCTAQTAARVDGTQGAKYSGSVSSVCTTVGGVQDMVWGWSLSVPTALAAFTDPKACVPFDDGQFKSITVAPNSGIGLKYPGAAGGASFSMVVVFTEEPN